MRWLRKHEFPVVPDDEAERKAAIAQSKSGLKESLDRLDSVVRVTGSLTLRNEVNGYAAGLRQAYGMKAS